MMLTSGDRPGDVKRCEELGIVAYLMKPIKQSELFDAIAAAMGSVVSAEVRAAAPADEPPLQLGPHRILLAEDSLVNQKLAIGLLDKWGLNRHGLHSQQRPRPRSTVWRTQDVRHGADGCPDAGNGRSRGNQGDS